MKCDFKIKLFFTGIDVMNKHMPLFCINLPSKNVEQYYVPKYPKGLELFKIGRMSKWSKNG